MLSALILSRSLLIVPELESFVFFLLGREGCKLVVIFLFFDELVLLCKRESKDDASYMIKVNIND